MIDQDRCWQAVCARDASQDGRFVFAVRSTGIYCRPSCPARRPRRENVSFHPHAAAAEAAGFRPCKRCSPHGQSPAQQLDELVAAACALLHAEPRLTLPQLAARIGLSASHLARAFKARTGLTPKAWASAERRKRLDTCLPESGSVLDAALDAGYAGTRALYEKPSALSPAQQRKRAQGEHLHFAIASCPLGLLLLATSARGVCALLFGDDEQALRADLQQRFAAASLEEDEHRLKTWLQRVLEQLEEPERAANLPLDIRGTAFQQRVWRALQGIPNGETRSYAQLAGDLDSHPRAIARACASNAIGLLLPCHRVVSSNGGLGGYRWGLERKRQLLEQERTRDEPA